MTRLTASTPASPAATTRYTPARKTQSMDKLLSMLSSGAQSAPLFAGHDDSNPYILPSFADNYEAWAYPDTQQAIFEDWITTAAPPPTALASPALTQQHMSQSPALSSPSSTSSIHSSPVLTGDIALSLASALQPSASMSVADYAAVLFPDLAASLSTTLASPSEQALGFAKPTLAPQTYARTEASLTSWATDFAGMLEAASPSASPSESPTPGMAQPQVAEEQRKRRDCEFLDSLPPQLKLKRRRTSNTKQKEKILAELLQPVSPSAAVVTAPMKSAAAAKPASEEDELSGDEDGLDAAALKRKKNTDAARRSRMRKILRIETLEGRVSDLETENAQLLQRIAQLEAERIPTA